MKKLLTATAILLATPFAALAGADFVEGDKTFAADAELGATITTGNTETTSLKGRLDMKHELGNWENQYLLEALYKEDSGEETGKRYYGLIQGNYKLNDVSYLFANANHEIDPFTGFDSKSTVSAGYGHKFVDTGKTLFAVEVGPGYQYKRLDDASALAAGDDTEESWVAHGVMNFETEITDSSKFKQLFVADYGDSLEGRSETSITANIIGALAMKFAVVVRYNSEPADDKKSTDTETNMTLLYSF
ncbi:hypothetical protein TUM4644_37520 [Shewanella colwelliana]|uniref:DUF481 domain-containing protein n=1 Tax=Shewanella colwelliana TaxID=23 RepID=A0A1E5IRB6_SHECO|nr:DUF481 domain-containing protein [Shewanella colwelliana]MDX1281802.1 DUF481 domain-containing protein [Shewanella colwelliana]OEG73085.1 hypothetical protein BEL05_06735 [Shewanella colwelliana]GIU36680.1 hypothetical protein TUM4644_37520 [Shewanella colwelliana]GIU44250.1 hypothetical protein TUM3794_31820 [Shewanella colwelliana]